ncbi:MAG TPA: N-acetyltransferase [Trueperaceae bacterium]|nr:N-acetyltransferase [Trueperaceae bacterium]
MSGHARARGALVVRRERPSDVAEVESVVSAAFAREPGVRPAEAALVAGLRTDPGALPRLTLLAEAGGRVVGHVVCSRGWVGEAPVLGLGPLAVAPERQGEGVGSALMHAVLAAAEALDEPLVALLGAPGYYGRFGFVPAAGEGIAAPDPRWGDHFQVRWLAAARGSLAGAFRYAAPFDEL